MLLRQVTLHQLRLFASLARHMNMTRAAEEMHVTPSAFSIQIKQLSQGLGLPLHEQSGKKLFSPRPGGRSPRRAATRGSGSTCSAWNWRRCRVSSAAASVWR